MANPILQLLDTIQGSIFLAILSAMEIINCHNPDLAQSKIEVISYEGYMIVVLDSKDDITHLKKSYAVQLESKQELNAHEISILQSRLDHIQLMGQIQGSSFLPIKKAIDIFQQNNLNLKLADYNIELVRESNSLSVIFSDRNRPAGTHGSVGKTGFEVEMNVQDLQILRSNYVR